MLLYPQPGARVECQFLLHFPIQRFGLLVVRRRQGDVQNDIVRSLVFTLPCQSECLVNVLSSAVFELLSYVRLHRGWSATLLIQVAKSLKDQSPLVVVASSVARAVPGISASSGWRTPPPPPV